jgi:hypothetical protein
MISSTRVRRCLRVLVAALGAACHPSVEGAADGGMRTFAGVYGGGFESSYFLPCPRLSWWPGWDAREPGDVGGGVWVEMTAAAQPSYQRAFQRAGLPLGRQDPSEQFTEYFVRWRATVSGPGRYGHLSLAQWEMRVDSVISVETPSARSCF